jgi:hypothetical protein
MEGGPKIWTRIASPFWTHFPGFAREGGTGRDWTQKCHCGCIRSAPADQKHKEKMEKSEKVKTEVAKALVGKVSRQKVADQLGGSQSTISNLDNRDAVKAMIGQEKIGFLGSVPQSLTISPVQSMECPIVTAPKLNPVSPLSFS